MTGNSIPSSLKSLFQNIKPINIKSDNDTECVNATVQQYLKREGVNFHTTHSPYTMGAVIVGFKRSLKKSMYKYFTNYNTLLLGRNKYLLTGNILFQFHKTYASKHSKLLKSLMCLENYE